MAHETKGKVKEQAGKLTGDEGLEREGKTERAGSKVKEAADKATDKAQDAVNPDRK